MNQGRERIKSKNRANSKYAPLKFFVVYIALTLLLHVIGPWEYKDERLWGVIVYMSFVLVLFSLGYHHVITSFRNVFQKKLSICACNFNRFYYISKIGLISQLVMTLILFVSSCANGKFSVHSIVNPGQVYVDALSLSQNIQNVSLLGQIKTLFSPVFYLSNAYFMFHYSRFSRHWRYCFIFTLFLVLSYELLTKGAQKYIFDVFILFAAVSFIRVFYNRTQFLRWRKYGVFFFAGALGIFIFYQLSRLNAYSALDYSGVYRMQLDRKGLMFSVFGDSLGLGISLFINYLTQGYYGLSLALQLPFEWTYGFGNSFALTSYADQYFGISGVIEKTYPFRMEAHFGWPAKMYWHTFFPWVASDLSFPGAALLMYPLGRIYARCFVDGLVFESPLSICLFYFLSTLLLFLPANNQLMQTREMMIGFIVVLLSWLVLGHIFRRAFVTRF